MEAKLVITKVTDEELVRFFYLVLLQRNVEGGGFAFWVNWLKSHSRKDLFQEFIGSEEFKNKWTTDMHFSANIEETTPIEPIPVPPGAILWVRDSYPSPNPAIPAGGQITYLVEVFPGDTQVVASVYGMNGDTKGHIDWRGPDGLIPSNLRIAPQILGNGSAGLARVMDLVVGKHWLTIFAETDSWVKIQIDFY